ncbi:formimidoylglutamase [Raineya orbicola]|jgi:formiminoglutamase|uniref:Formimidoylglutamase n=1 Tax=Raineya orbicola TaxID=2016530 RepID=A0A2N3IKV2_9BACT|nr:formimidoylglutamase [Raineya orbicola]PKQ70955.1 hutG: formimidoylglutamase [Raineya orbicola]
MYRKPNKKNWTGRDDMLIDGELGARWHQKVERINLEEVDKLPRLLGTSKGFTILGFCSDEGVRRNQGRVGAVEGPVQMRVHLSNLPWHFGNNTILVDGGDVFCLAKFLEEAQNFLGEKVFKILYSGYKSILIGGGHEIAWGHYLGVKKFLQTQYSRKLGIINFDAHFDMRENPQKQSTSGTSFLQIAQDRKASNEEFSYFVLGVQKVSNTPKLFQTAHDWGVEYITSEKMDFMFIQDIYKQLSAFIEKQDFLYVSVCLDVFSASYAPGVSALNGLGIYPTIVTDLIRFIAQTGKVLAFDIAELSPKHDTDDRTARLASNLVFTYIDACVNETTQR